MIGIILNSKFPDPSKNTIVFKNSFDIYTITRAALSNPLFSGMQCMSQKYVGTVCFPIVVETLTVPRKRLTHMYHANIPLSDAQSFKRENPHQSSSSYNVRWPRKARRQSTADGTKLNVQKRGLRTRMAIDGISSAKTLGFVQRIQ